MADKIKIICPNCGVEQEIDIEAELRKRVEGDIRTSYQSILEAEKKKYATQAKAEMDKIRQQEQKAAEEKARESAEIIREKEASLEEARKKQADALRIAREAEEKMKRADIELEEKLKEASEKATLELRAKLAEQRNEVEKAVGERMVSEHMLRDAEKERQLRELRDQIEDMKRKAEQGSQQSQGEILELELERALRAAFPLDEINEIKKGQKGADAIMTVKARTGERAGAIIYETKRTKEWDNKWIQKLKDDQREAKADVAIIVTVAMPEGIKRIGNIEGVWICDFESVLGLAMVVRTGIVEVARTRQALQGSEDKAQMLFQYVTSNTFIERVKAIAETYAAMQEDLEGEKRAYDRIWSKRGTQLERLRKATTALFGEMQGYAAEIQTPDVLALPFK